MLLGDDVTAHLALLDSEVADLNAQLATVRDLSAYGLVTTAQLQAWAAQADWWISYASGTTGADGASHSTPITQAEYERRTRGLTPTASGAVTVHYLDVPGAGNETIRTAFARIPLGTYLHLDFVPVAGITGVIAAYTDHVTTYGASHVHQITVTAQSWTASIAAGAALRNTTNGARKNVRVGLLYDYTGGVVGVSPPYLPSDPTFASFGATSFIAGDTFAVDTLPIVGSIDISRTTFEQSTADGVFGRFYATNVQVSGFAVGMPFNGSAVFVNCNIGPGVPLGPTVLVACGMINPIVGAAGLELFGCYGGCRFDSCKNVSLQDCTGQWGFSGTTSATLSGEIGSVPTQSVGLSLQGGSVVTVATGAHVYGGSVVNYGLLITSSSHLVVTDPAGMLIKGTVVDVAVNGLIGGFPGFSWANWRAAGNRYVDSADGTSITALGADGSNGVVPFSYFGATTGDQSLASTAGVLTDLRVAAGGGQPSILSTAFVAPYPQNLYIDFRCRVSTLVNAAQLAVLVNGSVVATFNPGAAVTQSRDWQTSIPMTPGTSYVVKVQYAVTVGGTLQIRPVGVANGDEFVSLFVEVIS